MITLCRRLKNDGFSLIEVLIALSMMAILLTALMAAITGMLNTLGQARGRVEHLFPLQNLFFDPDVNQKLTDKPFQKKLTKPAMTIAYQLKNPPAESQLGKKFKNVQLLVAQGTWQYRGEKKDALVSMQYKQPVPKDGKKE